ncbi:MAG: hypothetical protein M1835_006532 [Candelina submexicana]|nr:MAG: hypothetical protein M1835_006532 [Candelina submexicana]
MPRGNAAQSKVHYKGKEEDFIVMVDDIQAVQDWRKDKSIPLAQVVSGWKVFVTHKHGAQGVLDAASNQTLENEFGTHKDEEVVKVILEKGELQETQTHERTGSTNDSIGPRTAH